MVTLPFVPISPVVNPEIPTITDWLNLFRNSTTGSCWSRPFTLIFSESPTTTNGPWQDKGSNDETLTHWANSLLFSTGSVESCYREVLSDKRMFLYSSLPSLLLLVPSNMNGHLITLTYTAAVRFYYVKPFVAQVVTMELCWQWLISLFAFCLSSLL